MAKTPGFLTISSSRGYKYIQLRRSVFVKGVVKKQLIYSFGSVDKALMKMYAWREEPRMFPDDLEDEGYTQEDLNNWIDWVEEKKSKVS